MSPGRRARRLGAGRERRAMIKLPQSRKGKVIAVAVLAICAVALCKPLGWLGYLAKGTLFSVVTWFLPRILPVLAAFIAGPVGAAVVTFGAVYPYFFTYPPFHEMFRYNILLTMGNFITLCVFAVEFYMFAKRGGTKNWAFGFLCGTLDHFFVGMLCSMLVFRTVDKTSQIEILPFVAVCLAALAAHIVVFVLRRREKSVQEE